MIKNPFTLFVPFADALDVTLLTKEDAMLTDADMRRALKTDRTASAQQTHEDLTTVVREPVERVAGADGLITDTTDLTLMVRMADCQTFVLYAPTQNVLGVLHAGWKGLVAGAIPQFFVTLKREFGIEGKDVYVGAGPSLCERCAEFTDPVNELPGIDPRFFNGRHADLNGIADQMLADAGVWRENIERMTDCVKCGSGDYYSYREGSEVVVNEGRRNVLAATLRIRK